MAVIRRGKTLKDTLEKARDERPPEPALPADLPEELKAWAEDAPERVCPTCGTKTRAKTCEVDGTTAP